MQEFQIKTITANGLEFGYLEAGTGDNFILCLHGFPDTPHTWVGVMKSLAEAGYRVVAPFMRGYPPTQSAPDNQYSLKELAEDAIALLDAFEVEQGVIMGNDWGALAAYSAATIAPERLTNIITTALPHPSVINFGTVGLWKGRHVFAFQRRKASVAWFKRNNYSGIDTFFKRWSPLWNFTEAEVAPVRESLSQEGGVEGALAYYWSFLSRNGDPDVQKLMQGKISVPTMSIFGDSDAGQSGDALKNAQDAFTSSYRHEVLPYVGHFVQREAPEEVAKLVIDYLGSEPS